MAERNILEALDEALRTGVDIQSVVGAFYSLAEQSDRATKDQMLESLDSRIREHPGERIGHVAMLAGALVELGADPLKFPAAVFDRLLGQLSQTDADSEADQPEWYYLLERAAMACLSRSEKLRRALPQKRAIVTNLRRYQERYGFLGKMIQVLDDEPLVVLHPKTGRGFRFRMHGIGDNFQLHLLLLAALAGDGPDRIEGIVPSPEAVAASTDGSVDGKLTAESNWQLVNHLGLLAGGEIDRQDYDRTWIWNEGVPADIPSFEGSRAVLIGTSTIQRSWNAQRVFPGMAGRLAGPVPMERAEAQAMLAKMLPS